MWKIIQIRSKGGVLYEPNLGDSGDNSPNRDRSKSIRTEEKKSQ